MTRIWAYQFAACRRPLGSLLLLRPDDAVCPCGGHRVLPPRSEWLNAAAIAVTVCGVLAVVAVGLLVSGVQSYVTRPIRRGD